MPLFLVGVLIVYTSNISVARLEQATCPLRLGHSSPDGSPTASPARLKKPLLSYKQFGGGSPYCLVRPISAKGVFFRSCRGGPCAVALARSVFGFCALHKTPPSVAFTASGRVSLLSTICVDKRTFKELRTSRFAASPQIGQIVNKRVNLSVFYQIT